MELVVLSGKGGTGKTTVATALAELSNKVIKVDCDVDAPNLYLFYKGNVVQKTYFYGGMLAKVNEEKCVHCGECERVCKFDAIKDGKVNQYFCEGCGACTIVCPYDAVKLVKEKSADVYLTNTEKGLLSHAKMEVGSEGSGKLIAELKKNAKKHNQDNILTIVDGSPGIGCSVISSITGGDLVLVVTEPTKSGKNDLERILDLCTHFNMDTLVCINKYDINENISNDLEEMCYNRNVKIIGKIPYDDVVMNSVNELKSIIYYDESKANLAIREMWQKITNYITQKYKNEQD